METRRSIGNCIDLNENARTRPELSQHGKPATALPAAPPDVTAPRRRFSVRSGQRTTFVATAEIDWIEADGNYAVLHVGTQNHFLRETMSTLESELPAKEFLRVSRSAIVHLNRVKEIQTAAGNHHFAVLVDGQRVPVTRSVRQIGARLRALC